MKLCINGFEHTCDINPYQPFMLSVHSKILYTRIISSLLSHLGEHAQEPYAFIDQDNKAISPLQACSVIIDPFNLPWSDKSFIGELQKQLCATMQSDINQSLEIQQQANQLFSLINTYALQYSADYTFSVEWSLDKFLKSFAFGIELSEQSTLLDKLIQFLHFAQDIHYKKVIIFVNLSLFLSDNELKIFLEEVLKAPISMLFLESTVNKNTYNGCNSLVVDEALCEIVYKNC